MASDQGPLMTPKLLTEQLFTAEAALLAAERAVAADRAKRVKASTALYWANFMASRWPGDAQAIHHLRVAERRYRRVCVLTPLPTAEPAQRAYNDAVARLTGATSAEGGAA